MKFLTSGVRQLLALAVFVIGALGFSALLSTIASGTVTAAPGGYEDPAAHCAITVVSEAEGLVETSDDAEGLVMVLPDNSIQLVPQVGENLYQIPADQRGQAQLQVQGCGNIVAVSLPVPTAAPTVAPTASTGSGSDAGVGLCDLWLAAVDGAAEQGLIEAHPDAEGVVAVLPDGTEQALENVGDNRYQVPENLRNADVKFKVVGCTNTYTAAQLGIAD